MDFLISNYEIEEELLETAFLTCGTTTDKIVFRNGGWGGHVLATSTPYIGFKPLVDDKSVYLIVGDPLLQLDEVTPTDAASLGDDYRTAQVASVWDKVFTNAPDFMAPQHPSLLVRIHKENSNIEIVTDPGAFITLYYHKNSAGVLLATSPDLIAALVRPAIDMISMAERLASEQISYPYTFYDGVRQMPPGAHIRIDASGISSRKWWQMPVCEQTSYASTDTISGEIRRHGEKFLSRIRTQLGKRGYMSLSAGTDTRYLVDLVAETGTLDVTCICSTAVENNESWSARQVAKAVGLSFIRHPRPVDHRATCLLPPPLLIGTQCNWDHVHFHLKGLGILKDARFVLGAYTADTFLANADLYSINRKRILDSGKLSGEVSSWATKIVASCLSTDIQAKILKRRMQRLNLLDIKADTSQSLTNIWPFSQQISKGHFDALRRNYPAYEFFMTTPIIELGFRMNDSDKMNPGKATLLRPKSSALLKLPINPDSDPEVRAATQAFKKHYPSKLWPESLLYPGPWSEKKAGLSSRLEEVVAIARQAVARRLSLEAVEKELNGIHCYEAYVALQIAGEGRRK